MKTPKKSSKRHSLESNYPENSPSKKQKRTQLMKKFDKAPETESYSQNVVLSSQPTVNSVNRDTLDEKYAKRSIVKKSSSIFCNTNQDPQIRAKTNRRNAPSMALEYFFSPKEEIHSPDEEESSDDSKTEHLDIEETASKLRDTIKLKKPQVNADKSKNPANTSIIKSEESIAIESNKEDSENEVEILKKKKSEPKVKARKKKGNTLLSMIGDGSSCSDSDIEDKTDDNTIHLPLNKRKGKIASRSELSEICISSDEEADEFFQKQSIDKSNNIQRFALEEEAKDVEEMISVLESENQLPRDALRKLSKLEVTLSHQVPPQHMVETCAGSRGPTKEQKKIIQKLGPMKYGKFTPEEDNIIMRNWKSFCKTHDWDSKDFRPFLYMRHQKIGFVIKFEHRQKFVQHLANGLPWRTLYSVYWRFRNLCQPHVQSRYTPDEDKLIIAHMKNNPNGDSKNVRKFSELAKILNRTRASVWRRWRLLKKHEKPKSIKWNLRLVKKFIENLMLLTLSDDIRQLKDLDIPRVVWKKLSNKMKILSETLKRFWLVKLHMQLFCKMPIYLNDIRIKLIEYFYVKGICEWWEIEWSTIAKHFDGMTSLFLAQIFSKLFYQEKLEGMSLGEMVEYGYKMKKPDLQEAIMDACLPRISFKNGTVKLLDIKLNNNLSTGKLIEYLPD